MSMFINKETTYLLTYLHKMGTACKLDVRAARSREFMTLQNSDISTPP